MTCFVQYLPYRLAEGTWDARRDELGGRVLARIGQFAPNVPAAVIARQVLTPLDLEREYGLTEGNIFHGDIAPDQLFHMRPVPGWARYATPVPGLYLCAARRPSWRRGHRRAGLQRGPAGARRPAAGAAPAAGAGARYSLARLRHDPAPAASWHGEPSRRAAARGSSGTANGGARRGRQANECGCGDRRRRRDRRRDRVPSQPAGRRRCPRARPRDRRVRDELPLVRAGADALHVRPRG